MGNQPDNLEHVIEELNQLHMHDRDILGGNHSVVILEEPTEKYSVIIEQFQAKLFTDLKSNYNNSPETVFDALSFNLAIMNELLSYSATKNKPVPTDLPSRTAPRRTRTSGTTNHDLQENATSSVNSKLSILHHTGYIGTNKKINVLESAESMTE